MILATFMFLVGGSQIFRNNFRGSKLHEGTSNFRNTRVTWPQGGVEQFKEGQPSGTLWANPMSQPSGMLWAIQTTTSNILFHYELQYLLTCIR